MSGVHTLALFFGAALALTAVIHRLPAEVRTDLAEVLQLLTAAPAHTHHQATALHVCLPVTFSSQE